VHQRAHLDAVTLHALQAFFPTGSPTGRVEFANHVALMPPPVEVVKDDVALVANQPVMWL